MGHKQLEKLDRGLVAAITSEGAFLSWRLLAEEVTRAGSHGMMGAEFDVYRDGEVIARVRDSTNYLDVDGTKAGRYQVRAVMDGVEMDYSPVVAPWVQPHYDLPLQKPADGVTPTGASYTYSANDMSVGDVDGDGEYELIVKWDPSNSKDVSHSGYTGPVHIDCYKLDGTLLYRHDLGVNIRAGAHYTQLLVYDFDGDGRAELMFKTAPGSRTLRYDAEGRVNSERFITLLPEDVAAGFSHADDYRMSYADYYEHLVRVFMRWHEHEEVVSGRWPSTLEACFGFEPRYTYPLSEVEARHAVDAFLDEYAPGRSDRNRLRAFEGFIVDGPEYLTVFDGETGAELETIRYKPVRHDDGLMWGDYALPRIEPGNRVDRFLAGVAYLDGERPYAVFARGYYTRAALVAYRWDGERLREHWYADSGWVPMSNPFRDNPHARDGLDKRWGSLTCQGAHYLCVADVDGDGCDEIIYGSATIDHDGSVLYSSSAEMPQESATPGQLAKLGHGDAIHVAKIDPDRAGLQIFMVHEGGVWCPYGYTLRDAATGEVLAGAPADDDIGRGMVGDIDPARRGLAMWTNGDYGLMATDGSFLGPDTPGTNMSIRWSADMTTQIIEGTFDEDVTIVDWRRGRLLTAEGTRSNNGTKGNPCLVADIFGDWREELLVRTADSTAIRIYTSTELTDRKLYTLMHDAQYRVGIAAQNVVYNQPAYPSFYLASDIDWSKVPIPAERNSKV